MTRSMTRLAIAALASLALVGCGPETDGFEESEVWALCRDSAVREPGETHWQCRVRLCDEAYSTDPDLSSWEACAYGVEYPHCQPPFPATLSYPIPGYSGERATQRITESDLIGSYNLWRRFESPVPTCGLLFQVPGLGGTLTVSVTTEADRQHNWAGEIMIARSHGPGVTVSGTLRADD